MSCSGDVEGSLVVSTADASADMVDGPGLVLPDADDEGGPGCLKGPGLVVRERKRSGAG